MGKKNITLTIDQRTVTVPDGTLIVNAAKKVGIDIPVFCYHPKMEPVGMCRMCLVEIGRPVIDRTSGEVQREADGSPKIQFGAKLETACTTPVSEGMAVVTTSEKVKAARREMLEFILTSHPLDCPICDKGGECPLQNLTLKFGPGQSRFIYDEKMRLAKHVPLGELIFLDRERCIQCGRCVRFQHNLADDPVIDFYQRGRSLEIITQSEPGFDSVFSGNTTDICPVGALTTADFRFGARPWELDASASICNLCPVGCNITYNTRREAKSDGKRVIKRVMPRQNEEVNEIWMCDKGRFAYHYTEDNQRLTSPLIRIGNDLVPVSWDEALNAASGKLRAAGADMLALAGGRLANEDLFNLAQLTRARGGETILSSYMAGGDLVAKVGAGKGTKLSELGAGSAILVVACDLHEEAPVWWLQVKQAVERGVALIVINGRPTRLERYASHVLRYSYGDEAAMLAALLPGAEFGDAPETIREAAKTFGRAENALIFFGSDGLGLEGSTVLSRACAELLVKTGHIGRPNNGLIGVWPNGNTLGAWDLGYRPRSDLAQKLAKTSVALVAACDPAGDDPSLADAILSSGFVIVLDLFLTETAQLADLVLPAQAYTEREGTYTSGERRVQLFYQAIPAVPGPLPDYAIAAEIGKRLGIELEERSSSHIFQQIANNFPAYYGLNYERLAEFTDQWPIVGRQDLYFGGTMYDNRQGLGIQLAPEHLPGLPLHMDNFQVQPETIKASDGELVVVPVTRLFDRGQTMLSSELIQKRLAKAELWLNPETAGRLGLADLTQVDFTLNGITTPVSLHLDANLPAGIGLVPRSVDLPISAPALVRFQKAVEE
ncbi:MAG TPA: NADH-quinone oxidoreductase subunit NuoG [Anaerolineaceae bacterium]|nr:NADH-quinone oxidoreductase subunit NuoG [Anaerolineaceae bacterium]